MNNPQINQLNQRFAVNSENTTLRFVDAESDIPRIVIQNRKAKALISLQGAHLLSWVPAGQSDVLWLSEQAIFKQGKSVRGGIPICWPWFGAHETNDTLPAHGFARTVMWQVVKTEALSDDETMIVFRLDCRYQDQAVSNMWSHAVSVEYTLIIGDSLTLSLKTHNHSDHAVLIGQAFHTYFNIDNIKDTQVCGLENKSYLDKPDNFKQKIQSGPLVVTNEVDRVFINTEDAVAIKNKSRVITISKQGSCSTVVWNPWKDVAEKMGDMGEHGYRQMLCVESANAADDTRTIEAGASHQLSVNYQLS